MDPRGTQAFTKFCPACKLGNDANALTCKYCGSSLNLISAKENAPRRASQTGSTVTEKDSRFIETLSSPSRGVAVYSSGNTRPIAIMTDDEFILGRETEGVSETMVDLTDLDGLAMGVSRRHAMIRAVENGYVIVDLNSSNGTWLNGQILIPTQQYDLPSGAAVQLAHLKLVLIFQSPSNKGK
jgi:hypothetical protein